MVQRTPPQYDWDKALFNDRRLTKHFTSPRRSKITHVTLHHMTIVVPGSGSNSTSSLEGCYKTWQTREASANYGVSGNQVWQYVSDNDAAWSDADSASNHSTLSIEHTNSTPGPSWQISDETMKTGARLVAHLHKLYALGRPSRKTVRMHRDYYATSCPGPYMVAHLSVYIAEAARVYDEITGVTPAPPVVTPPTTTPLRHSSSVLIQNCASQRNDATVGGAWSKRLPILAKVILDSDASFIVCPELYAGQRPALTKAISTKYGEAAVRGGRVLYYRKGRWASSTGFWWKYLNGLTKPAVCDIFINTENKTRLTVSGWHTSYQTTAAGSTARRKEVANGIRWIKGLKLNYGRTIFAGDFNSPADASTRIDDVEPVFESFGYHDLEDDHEAPNGPGGYHLDRVFAGAGVTGERIVVARHKGSDHPATYVEFSY